MTDTEIRDLVFCPKAIGRKDPSRGYRYEQTQRRCNLELTATADSRMRFSIFVRQNLRYIENFTVGLNYHSNDRRLGMITLVRYNGPHGEAGRQPDGHYAKFHIHRITAAEIASGSRQPRELHREITDRYGTLEEALMAFFQDTRVANYWQFCAGMFQRGFLNGNQYP